MVFRGAFSWMEVPWAADLALMLWLLAIWAEWLLFRKRKRHVSHTSWLVFLLLWDFGEGWGYEKHHPCCNDGHWPFFFQMQTVNSVVRFLLGVHLYFLINWMKRVIFQEKEHRNTLIMHAPIFLLSLASWDYQHAWQHIPVVFFGRSLPAVLAL